MECPQNWKLKLQNLLRNEIGCPKSQKIELRPAAKDQAPHDSIRRSWQNRQNITTVDRMGFILSQLGFLKK